MSGSGTCTACLKPGLILSVHGKVSDTCSLRYGASEYRDYVPSGLGIGGGDYLEFELCLGCGKVQGEFPVPEPEFVGVK